MLASESTQTKEGLTRTNLSLSERLLSDKGNEGRKVLRQRRDVGMGWKSDGRPRALCLGLRSEPMRRRAAS